MFDGLQEKVVFVTCKDDDKVAEIQKLNRKFVRLELLDLFLTLSFCMSLSLSLAVYHMHFLSFLQSPYLSFCSVTLAQSLCEFLFVSLYLSLHLSLYRPLLFLILPLVYP